MWFGPRRRKHIGSYRNNTNRQKTVRYFDRSYVISGYGKEGTVVAIYKLSGDVYVKTNYEWQIGASTYFAIPIELDSKKNILLCRAEDSSGQYQHAKLEITYLGSSLSDVVRNITVDATSIPY
jgi:hypothetical protein